MFGFVCCANQAWDFFTIVNADNDSVRISLKKCQLKLQIQKAHAIVALFSSEKSKETIQ
jgi:hypothetical protein